MYPSAPLLLRSWTAERFPERRVATKTPANLQEVLAVKGAVICIQRYGGDRAITLDRPQVDVDVFALDEDTAEKVCNDVCNAWEWEMPGAFIDIGSDGRAVVAKVQITVGPFQRPVTDSTLSRTGASAALVLHSRP
jgi:hypothetical protein